MKNRSIIATLVFVCVCAALVSTHPRVAYAQEKNYYLTKTLVQGNGVLTACASGYHVASFIELSDLSHLHDLTHDADAFNYPADHDQGDGPPLQAIGWIRSNCGAGGLGNCNVWTTNSSTPSVMGSTFYITSATSTSPVTVVIQLLFDETSCANSLGVWCIQNP